MEDLSHLLPGSPFTALVPTSQEGGNMVSSNELAMSGPGTVPVTPIPDRDHQGDPSLVPIDHTRPAVVTSGDEPAPASVWTDVSSRPWAQASDAQSPGGAQAPRDSGGRWRQT